MRNFNILWSAALADSSRDAYVSDWSLSSIWADESDNNDLVARAERCGRIWDIAHMSVADIRRATGLSQGKFAEAFCIPKNTIINWEHRGGCADYVRHMLARLCGLTRGLIAEDAQ